jgi:DNA (cytosine-5-)-methyltransferase
MIFSSVKNTKNKDEIIEIILVFIRIVEVIAEKYKALIPPAIMSEPILDEIKNLGVIENEEDLSCLKNITKDLYDRLISCVSFYIANKYMFGNQLDKLNNKKRKQIQIEYKKEQRPTFADFFAGAGGLSYGFTQAGFRVCFANDFEDVCVRTYRYNHPEIAEDKVVKDDIRKIANNIQNYIDEDVDVVVGGPPCQGFSSANQQRIIDDPRNELYKYYIECIKKILPKFVVMENVRGMLKVANQVVEDYERIKEMKNGVTYSYTVSYKILNSMDFSVAQSRERLIYIAIRNDIAGEKGISPETIFEEINEANEKKPHYLLRDALEYIKPLDAPRIKNTNEKDDVHTGKKIDLNSFSGKENAYLKLINNGRNIPIIFNHKARYVNDTNYDIYRLLNQGDDASDPKISSIMPYRNRLHCFKDKYFKLIADKPSRTITAHLRMDCHSHIHPFQIRAITPREAARCQSFPDDYLFLGPYLKTYMQIGNAVPCLMAKGIAKIIKKYL